MKTIARVSSIAVMLLLVSAVCSAACTGGSVLSGYYGMLVGGNGKYLTGAVHFDGNCNVSGSNITGTLGGSYVTTSVSGTYGQNSDSTVNITLNFAGQSAAQTYIVGVSESGNKARGVESDGTVGATIDLTSQLTTLTGGYTASSLNGTYAVSCLSDGAADLNYVTFNGSGLTGIDVYDQSGTVNTANYSGNYSVNSDGTFSGVLTSSGFTQYSFNGVIDNGQTQIEYIYEDAGSGVLACTGKQSTTTNLQGYYGMVVDGFQVSGGGKYLSASVYFNGAGSLTATNVQGGSGSTYTTTTGTGTYVVNSNNTVTITLNLANQSTAQTYVVGVAEGGNEALGVEYDGSAYATIDLQSQLQLPATKYNLASLNGTYSASCGGSEVDLNYVTFNGNGSLTGVDAYYNGSYGDSPYTGTYTVNSDGTFSGSFAGSYSVFTMTGVIDNGTSEIEFTYDESGVGGIVGCIGESTYVPPPATPTVAPPALSPAPGAYSSTATVSLSDVASGSVIHYTTNGSTPTVNSPTYSGPISVTSTTTIQAIGVVSGNSSGITAGTYFISNGLPTAAAPTFSPAPGSYSTAQSVTLSDSTPGATIYYTTNGSAPNTSSSVYNNSPISVSATTNLQAIAVASSYGNSAVTSGTYVIGSVSAAPAPTFSPAPGPYSSTQSVTLTDSLSTATIYYTTDGSMPTTNSAVYGSPIQVSSTTTINAIAVASGYGNSSETSGTYTISAGSGGPTVNLSGFFNVYGIWTAGSSPANGGFDSDGYGYTASLIGNSVTYQGVTFPLGSANAADAISAIRVSVPSGAYSQLFLLGAAANGPQSNQTVTVTYTDGTVSTFTQSFSDWCHYSNFTGETLVSQTSTRVTPGGGNQSGTINVYGYTFQLTSGKIAAYVTVPRNRNVVFLAMGFGGSAVGTPITPFVQVNNGTWQQSSTITVSAGASVNLGPQPISSGYWSWTGPNGFTSNQRQINNIPLSSGNNTYVATYTNSAGLKTTQTFTITVSTGWTEIGTSVNSIACASDGTLVVANNSNQTVWEYLSGKWTQLPGQMKHLAIVSKSSVWGIGLDNNVYRLSGSNWIKVGTNAADIAAASDGTVLVTNASNYTIWKYVSDNNWTSVSGGASIVAAVSNNNYYVVGGSNYVFHYDGSSWSVVGSNALYVKAASDGTVLMTNSSGQVWQYVSGTTWVQVPGTVAVAVPVRANSYFAIGTDNNVYSYGSH